MEEQKLYKHIGTRSWGGRAEHGELDVSIVKIGDIQYIKAVGSYYDDACTSTLMNQTTKVDILGKDWFENNSIEEILFRINSSLDINGYRYKDFTEEEIQNLRQL